MKATQQTYNFNAGPAALPKEVLEIAQQEFVNFQSTGMSIMEMSHRSKVYEDVHNEAKALVKELLGISDQYEILFLQGGASLQFSMVPMNLLDQGKTAGYVLTGSWSEKAIKEADKVGQTRVIASSTADQYKYIPEGGQIEVDQELAYVHITSNNTIFGTQWKSFPHTKNVPLIADMSSDIMYKPIDVNQFGLIYAGAQKNLGPSGVTLVIIRKDLLEPVKKELPTVLQYSTYEKNNSLYNTPPTFGIYMLGLVMKWIKLQGGLDKVYQNNQEKAQLIYDVIDQSEGFYMGHAEKDSRSLMNITFRLATEELEKKFLAQAKEEGFVGLNGHRSVGGCRASTYNAVTMESCKALQQFMLQFQKDNQ